MSSGFDPYEGFTDDEIEVIRKLERRREIVASQATLPIFRKLVKAGVAEPAGTVTTKVRTFRYFKLAQKG